MQFKTESPVTWSVNGIPGGNADVGTISGTGLYTAPGIVPLPNNQVSIESSANIYPSSKGSYGVSVLNPIPIVTTITPGSFSEGMAQIVVNGSAFVYGAQILWNGVAVPTTYISGTQLVAIITENTPGTYPVTVVNPDPGSACSKSINALVQPGQVVIQLQPAVFGSTTPSPLIRSWAPTRPMTWVRAG
jgi:IPT/TIG domain